MFIRKDFHRYGELHSILQPHYDTKTVYLFPLYKEMLIYFKDFDAKIIFQGIFWNNNSFAFGEQPFYIRDWHEKVILYINDILVDSPQNSSIKLSTLREREGD